MGKMDGTIREKFLAEFSLSKSWLITNLLYALYNKVGRIPIYIKSSVSPCRDTFWDAHFEYDTENNVASVSIYFRDSRIFDLIDFDGLDNSIRLNSDVGELQNSISEYVERLAVICFEKFAIKIAD